jgi:hypothetical protein
VRLKERAMRWQCHVPGTLRVPGTPVLSQRSAPHGVHAAIERYDNKSPTPLNKAGCPVLRGLTLHQSGRKTTNSGAVSTQGRVVGRFSGVSSTRFWRLPLPAPSFSGESLIGLHLGLGRRPTQNRADDEGQDTHDEHQPLGTLLRLYGCCGCCGHDFSPYDDEVAEVNTKRSWCPEHVPVRNGNPSR